MFNIFETTCVLLIIIVHCSLNIFGGTMHEESSMDHHSEIVEKLKNEIELKQKDIVLMQKDVEDKRYMLKAFIELQKAKPNNCLKDGRSENENNVVVIPSDLRNNDVHFNCIKKCSPTSQSCDEALSANNFIDGVYLLKEPKSDLKPFYAYCTHEDKSEQGWMVIQRRQDGSVNFTRTWSDYKLGFGDLDGEYWIGLERIHQITNSKPHELWIVAQLWDNNETVYAKYSKFIVGSAYDGYNLTVGGYSGDMFDIFAHHNSVKFGTIDKDNRSIIGKNCADYHDRVGWWYKRCGDSPFNKYYTHMGNWILYNDRIQHKLRKVFMAIRPK